MPTVYIINRSNHNFDAAKNYGELVYLSEGKMNKYATNSMLRVFSDQLENSTKDDYLLLCSLNIMNSLACAIFAFKHGCLNLLLYKDGKYIERNHKFI